MFEIIPIVLFAFAALFGVILLSYVLGNKFTPKAITIIHGLFAVLGLVSLIVVAYLTPIKLWLSVIVFSMAALGGFYLLFKDLTGKIPKSVAVIHGLLAISGFAILIASVLYFYKGIGFEFF